MDDLIILGDSTFYYTVQLRTKDDLLWIINCVVKDDGRLHVLMDLKRTNDDYQFVPVEVLGKILSVSQQKAEYHQAAYSVSIPKSYKHEKE